MITNKLFLLTYTEVYNFLKKLFFITALLITILFLFQTRLPRPRLTLRCRRRGRD